MGLPILELWKLLTETGLYLPLALSLIHYIQLQEDAMHLCSVAQNLALSISISRHISLSHTHTNRNF